LKPFVPRLHHPEVATHAATEVATQAATTAHAASLGHVDATIHTAAATHGSVDWASVISKLPCGRSPSEWLARDKLFRKFDGNGNGVLSFTEMEEGLRVDLQLDAVVDCTPVIMRAFSAAKNCGENPTVYIEKREFRIMLQYIHIYLELYQVFQLVENNKDRRLSLQEFAAFIPALHKWGLEIAPSKAAEVFRQIDVAGGGLVLFDEFADWAIKMKLDLGEEDSQAFAPQATNAVPTIISVPTSAYPAGSQMRKIGRAKAKSF